MPWVLAMGLVWELGAWLLGWLGSHEGWKRDVHVFAVVWWLGCAWSVYVLGSTAVAAWT
jgi:hypothetical protein